MIVILALLGLRIFQQYEKGVVFCFGKIVEIKEFEYDALMDVSAVAYFQYATNNSLPGRGRKIKARQNHCR